MRKISLGMLMVIAAAAATQASTSAQRPRYDLVIYGCTPAGITAAVEARREGRSVSLICRDKHLGGMSTNALGMADSGDPAAIGGLARQFYRDVRSYYAARGVAPLPGQTRSSGERDTMWVFEPHVAEAIYETWLRSAGVTPVRSAPLLRNGRSVVKRGARIVALTLGDGRVVRGRVFIDASYEGDLMAEAGVRHAVGREANQAYGETLNGNQPRLATHHQFTQDVDPYVVPGDPGSGLLAGIETGGAGTNGAGDTRVQAYNFRLCMTKVAANRAPILRPKGYTAADYELLGRYLDRGWRDLFRKYNAIPNSKTDTNNHGPFSTDFIGGNRGYATGSDARRARIVAAHRRYQQGLLWFMQNDPRSPADVRAAMEPWGLCRDEFRDNGHWPRELYIREARRMVSDFVTTERHLRGELETPEPVGLGSYAMDSHHVRRYVDVRGFVRNEGDVQVELGRPYAISYRAIVPRQAEADNLIVPVAVSASHIAYGSIRMEPVFMILGQSAAAAAGLAIDRGQAVQDVRYADLRPLLDRQGQVLDVPADPSRP